MLHPSPITVAVLPAAAQCPLATPADFAAYPSTLRTIQPESLFPFGTPTACPGGTNAQPCGGHRVYVPDPANPALRTDQAVRRAHSWRMTPQC